MAEIILDARIALHPLVFPLSPSAFKEFIRILCYIAEYDTDWTVPSRLARIGLARELVEAGLLAQDGGLYRATDAAQGLARIGPTGAESGQLARNRAAEIGPIGPKSGQQIGPTGPKSGQIGPNRAALGSKPLAFGSKVLASKPESSKALALEGKWLADFERFWDAFGLKTGRRKALEAWRRATKTNDPDVIIHAARSYKNWLENHPSPPTQKYAQGWLNDRRWEDELPPYPTQSSRPSHDPAMNTLRKAYELAREGR